MLGWLVDWLVCDTVSDRLWLEWQSRFYEGLCKNFDTTVCPQKFYWQETCSS